MKNITLKVLILAFVVTQLSSCKTTGRALLYTESSIQPQDVVAKTVAILPNRLPVTLQNSELWRTRNYETIKRILVMKGYNVIDYNTSNQLFQQSGLPLEDTKSSRDKYAELAQKLNADLLVFPYYGTTFSSTGLSNSYIAIGSLQFYSVKHNDFSARIDLEGIRKIQTWPNLIPYVGIIYQIVTMSPMKNAHKKAFERAFNEGFAVYSSRFNSGGAPTYRQAQNPAKPESKYDKYSIEELETLKKVAVGNGDYKTAGEIKEELTKRK